MLNQLLAAPVCSAAAGFYGELMSCSAQMNILTYIDRYVTTPALIYISLEQLFCDDSSNESRKSASLSVSLRDDQYFPVIPMFSRFCHFK